MYMFVTSLVVSCLGLLGEAARPQASGRKPPIIFTPGTVGTVMEITVKDQRFLPDCPASASYPMFLGADFASFHVNNNCANLYLGLSIPKKHEHIYDGVNNKNGVTVDIPNWGTLACAAPTYHQSLFPKLISAGYQEGKAMER